MSRQQEVTTTIAIVIPCAGAATALERTLRSVAAQDAVGRRPAIIVANDGNDPGVSAVCQRHGVAMVTIRPRRGSYFARNRALEKVSGDPVVFLDAGIEVPPGWLASALRALGDADYLACEVDIAAVPRPTAAQAYEAKHSYPIGEYLRSQHYGVTAGLLVTRRLLEALGGFDERLLSGGDLEFGDRVHRAGFRQAYLPAPVLLHAPRRAWPFLRKQFRVRIGYDRLARRYPLRFPRRSPGAALLSLLRALLPPHWHHVGGEFPAGTGVLRWRRFLFLWALKLCRAAADLAGMLAPRPRSRTARIDHCDFSAGRS
jgi:glycosyltransferase involved in cell wall biosynthesis